MANEDTNAIIRQYLVDQAALTAVVDQRIMYPRLAETQPGDTKYPAIGFFSRGGPPTNPYIPGIETPSVQFDCWAEDIDGGLSGPRGARVVYGELRDALQGIQQQTVTVGGLDYRIMSAIEEVPGQDLVDVDIPNLFRVLTFFLIMMQATT